MHYLSQKRVPNCTCKAANEVEVADAVDASVEMMSHLYVYVMRVSRPYARYYIVHVDVGTVVV